MKIRADANRAVTQYASTIRIPAHVPSTVTVQHLAASSGFPPSS